ncbi:hypothetical protein ACFWAY_29730 [Rhodococcus sp. NPDC059968]|uniref:hypothetical protein n=1 Tax=Rhodococcus sp. NPDC059968 TaxID=3347017 RepID=UPI003672CA8F
MAGGEGGRDGLARRGRNGKLRFSDAVVDEVLDRTGLDYDIRRARDEIDGRLP